MNPSPRPPQPHGGHGPPPGTPYGHGGQAQPPGYPPAPGQAPYAPGYPAPRQYAQQPPRLSGAPLFLRIMMFVGGVIGILLAVLMGGLSLVPPGTGGTQNPGDLVIGAVVCGTYGAASLVLAILAKRRTPVIRWSVLALHVVALCCAVFHAFWISDIPDVDYTVPTLGVGFSLMNVILVSVRDSSRYYTKPSERPATHEGHVQPPYGGHLQQQYPQGYAPGGRFPGHAQQPPSTPPGGYGPPRQ